MDITFSFTLVNGAHFFLTPALWPSLTSRLQVVHLLPAAPNCFSFFSPPFLCVASNSLLIVFSLSQPSLLKKPPGFFHFWPPTLTPFPHESLHHCLTLTAAGGNEKECYQRRKCSQIVSEWRHNEKVIQSNGDLQPLRELYSTLFSISLLLHPELRALLQWSLS